MLDDTLDIRSGGSWPVNRLSNFALRHFIFDRIECASLEGVLQSFKYKNVTKQHEVCALAGVRAKRTGTQVDWQTEQTLYWNGKEYPRAGDDYQRLLDRLYEAVYKQDSNFVSELYATRGKTLIHSKGKDNVNETVLAEQEFCSRLEMLRDRILLMQGN